MINKKETIKQHAILIALLCLFSLFVHRNWFQEGIHVYGESNYFDKEFIEDYISFPHIWQSAMDGGNSNIMELSKHPVRFVWGLLVQLFSPRISTFLLFGIIPMFLPCFTMYWFAQALLKRPAISFVASFLFTINTYLLSLQQGGQTGEAIAVSLFPVCLLLFIRAIDCRNLRSALYGGLAFALTMCFDVRFSYLLGWACLCFFPFYAFTGRNKSKIASRDGRGFNKLFLVGIFFMIPVLLHSYWITPMLFYTGMPVFGNYSHPSWVDALSYATIKHALALYHPCWGIVSDVRNNEVKYVFWIIPLFAMIGMVFHYKNIKIWYLTLIVLVGVLLAKGSNPPFDRLYQWLFLSVPGFRAFRDPLKMYSLIALAYPPLFGAGIICLWDKIIQVRKFRPVIKYSYIVVVSLACILLVYPGMKDQMKGQTFEPKSIPPEYMEVKIFLLKNAPGYHTIYYPRTGFVVFHSEAYPYYGSGNTFNPFDQFLYSMAWNKNVLLQTTKLSAILGILNIKYIALPLPTDKWAAYPLENNKASIEKLRNMLLQQENIIDTTNPYILENQNALPRFYMNDRKTLIVGGLGGALALLEKESYYFREHNICHIEKIVPDEFFKMLEQANEILFYKQYWDDLVLGALAHEYGIDLWPYADYSGQNLPNTTWTKTVIPPNGHLSYSYGCLSYSGKGIVECYGGEASLRMPFEVRESDVYEVWLRVSHGPEKGSTSVTIDDLSPNKISQKDEQGYFGWVKFGETFLNTDMHQLMIKAEPDGSHDIDQAVIVKKGQRVEAEKVILGKIKDKEIFVFEKNNLMNVSILPDILEDKKSETWYKNGYIIENKSEQTEIINKHEKIEWVKINPTKYNVIVKTKNSSTLVFAATYDPGWVLKQDGKVVSQSKLVNGRLNGFEITGEVQGGYVVEYAPQKYVKIGLLISSVSLMGIVALLSNRVVLKRRGFHGKIL